MKEPKTPVRMVYEAWMRDAAASVHEDFYETFTQVLERALEYESLYIEMTADFARLTERKNHITRQSHDQ
jgi:hypothetical protein